MISTQPNRTNMFTKLLQFFATFVILTAYSSPPVSTKSTDVDNVPIYSVSSDAKPGHVVTNLEEHHGETLKIIHLKGTRNLKPWFSIHKPGRLVVRKHLTQFSGDYLELLIQHKSENNAKRTQKVIVNVVDKSAFYGFSQQPYIGKIPENAPVGTQVGNLESLEEDLSTFPYYCTMELLDAPAVFFKITGWPTNTRLVSKIDFDRERQPFVSFTLRADCPTSTQEAMVTVHILDENDNTPQFLTNLYEVKVTKSDLTTGADCLVQVYAYDPDTSDTVTYAMEEHRIFAVDESSGCIFIKDERNLHHSKSYELILSARDGAGHEGNKAVVQIDVDIHTQKIARHPSNQHRSKRDVELPDFFQIFATRPTKTFVIPMIETGQLFTVAEESSEANSERFEFREPAPDGLLIEFETGIVSIMDGYTWNTTAEVSFVVNVSRADDPLFEDDQPVMMYIVDRAENDPIFTNLPRPMWTTIPIWFRPDRVFYTAQAIDSQSPYNATVTYVLEAGGEGCFKIDAVTGGVSVDCRQEFILGYTYQLSLSAQVVGTVQKDTTPVQVLNIRVGEMDPVFYEDYTGVMMPETLPVGSVVVAIRARSFVGLDITYTMVEQDPVSQGVFTLQANGDLILDRARLHISDPHQYRMVVNITEATTGKEESADVYVTLIGENRNTPFFPGTVYPLRSYAEDSAVGAIVMSVTAVDLDQGINGQMSFTVSDSHFAVSSADGKVADITVNERLDYDRQPLHMYELTLMATDMGTPALSGSTRVQVWLSDVRDEPPVLDPLIQEVRVNQDAAAPTRIHIVQAYDPDIEDTITFAFGDGTGVNGPFDLDSNTGAITLNRKMQQSDPSNLTITVTDNNAMSSDGYVLIQSIGVNHPPDFSSCYSVGTVSVRENQPVGTSVANVTVTEVDTGVNGELDVRFEYNAAIEDPLFDIGAVIPLGNGEYLIELVTAVVFDRENPEDNVYFVGGVPSYQATILAEDNGTPQLGATCFFFVEILDENDEKPRFDENPSYDVIMMDNIGQGVRVVRVFAIDDDAGDNAVFTYVMTEDPACPNCLAIDGTTGWITRGTGALNSVTSVQLQVSADDGVNTPETVNVNIAITSDSNDMPPQWLENIDDLPPVQIRENETIGYTNPDLSFDTNIAGILSLVPGRTPRENSNRDFIGYEQNGGTRLNIRIGRSLDYERVSQYSLRLRASALDAGQTGPFNDARLRVDLIDVNDNVPEFVGLLDDTGSYPAAVSDETLIGVEIVKVTAVDRDTSAQHNTITYSLACVGNETDCDAFNIDGVTGIITTAVDTYDPALQAEYFVRVSAVDNSPAPGSNDPFEVFITVRVVVTGSSLEAPYFEQPSYTATVVSGSPASTNVTIIQAVDPLQGGNAMQYVLLAGNEQRRFAVDSRSGLIYTTAEILYERQQNYTIECGVFDGLNTATTTLYISVTPRNVYPPTLQDQYDSVQFSEADPFTPSNPLALVTVSATDPEGSTSFSYSIEGAYVVDQRFRIEQTGEVLLQAQLDRDYPYGTDNWLITVVADDQDNDPTAQRGYAVLNVRPGDINDNAPLFDVCCLEGHVAENAVLGTSVLQLVATDYDTGVNAQLTFGKVTFPVTGPGDPSPGTDLFTISTDGLITTNWAGFDCETTDRYKAVVYVEDGGSPSLRTNQTIDIIIDDVNEFAPDFDPASYSFVIDEELPVGASVGAVFAIDLDMNPDPRLVFTIDPPSTYFYMDSIYQGKAGIIRMSQRIDFEDSGSPNNFQLTVVVTDRGGLTDTAAVEVTVVNVNDHVPVLTPASDTVDIPENTLTMPDRTFTAVDGDNPAEVIYFRIDYEASDPDKTFWIDPSSGKVSLLQPLDRETIESYSLIILGIDQGTPALTGTATLSVTVTDENDNRPSIISIEPAFPVVGAATNINDVVVVITIEDPDTTGNPPTMGYCNDNFCSDFSFVYDNTNTGTLRAALDGYSRAALGRTFYDLNFELGDDVGSVVETVRVYIESTNSQMHGPGESFILVYNYMGLLPETEIGRVYCEDSDDWDLADKTFAISGVVDPAYFLVDSAEGRITMKKGAPRGNHTLTVDVTDSVYGSTATCTTTVSIMYLYDDALVHTGSLRLSGTTAEALIERVQAGDGTLQPSLYTRLRRQLATIYGTTEDLVHLYTVWDTADGYVDIFIVAEGTAGYFRSSKVNGLIWVNKDVILSDLGLTIVSAPINLCMDDSCFGTGCSTVMDTVPEGLIVTTNQTSLVGLGTSVSQECVCEGTNFTSDVPVCEANTCANGGICEEYYNGYRCVCLDGFDGPNCEQTKLRLEGSGWAWYDHLPACDTLTVRFSFMTLVNDAVLLYNGPIFSQASTTTVDYLGIQLVGGYPRAQVDVGNGEMGLIIDGQDSSGSVVMQPLSDGEWHTIEFYMTPGFLRLTVDHCSMANVNETIDWTVEDRSPCEVTMSFPLPVNNLLNVFTPLELGGRYNPAVDRPQLPGSNLMVGCIKDVWINGELVDLHIGGVGESLATVDGCPSEGCGVCPNNSVCVGNLNSGAPVCRCLPGYYGDNCIAVPVVDFTGDTSYIEWELMGDFNSTREIKDSEIQLQFRTRQLQGTIFYTDSFSTLERSILEVVDTHLQFRYDLGSGDRVLTLPLVNVSDGEWHTTRVQRFGTKVILLLDDGQGKFHAEANPVNDFRTMVISGEGLTGGAYIERNPVDTTIVTVYEPFPQSCIRDVRLDQAVLPVASTQPSDAAFISDFNSVLDTCDSAACDGVACPLGFCQDVWREHMCVCPVGEIDNGAGVCIPVNDCSLDPCVNGDCVMVEDPNDPQGPEVWRCNCYFGWTGTYCNETEAVTAAYTATVSTGWIVAVMCAFILLLIIVLIVVCCSKKKKAGLLDEPFDEREMFKEYNEEGAGEDDMHAYDIKPLQKPYEVPRPVETPRVIEIERPPELEELTRAAPEPMHQGRAPFQFAGDIRDFTDLPNVGKFILGRLVDADGDPAAPPFDSIREYEYEGEGSTAGSLSSIQTSSSGGDQDFEYLRGLGLPFRRLADLYHGSDEQGSDDDSADGAHLPRKLVVVGADGAPVDASMNRGISSSDPQLAQGFAQDPAHQRALSMSESNVTKGILRNADSRRSFTGEESEEGRRGILKRSSEFGELNVATGGSAGHMELAGPERIQEAYAVSHHAVGGHDGSGDGYSSLEADRTSRFAHNGYASLPADQVAVPQSGPPSLQMTGQHHQHQQQHQQQQSQNVRVVTTTVTRHTTHSEHQDGNRPHGAVPQPLTTGPGGDRSPPVALSSGNFNSIDLDTPPFYGAPDEVQPPAAYDMQHVQFGDDAPYGNAHASRQTRVVTTQNRAWGHQGHVNDGFDYQEV